MKCKLRKLGHSLGITIPANLLKKLRLGVGDSIEIDILTPAPCPRYEVEYSIDGLAKMIELEIPKECDVLSWINSCLNKLHNSKEIKISELRLLDGGAEE